MRRPSDRATARLLGPLAALLCLGVLTAVAGCGGSDPTSTTASAPSASSFPAVGGQTLPELFDKNHPTNDLVVAPAGSVYDTGKNRFAFAVFEPDRTQVADADVAIYASHGTTGKVIGPFPGRYESLATDPAFTAQTTASDPDAAKGVYVTEVNFDQPGHWNLIALVNRDGSTVASRLPTIDVGGPLAAAVPKVGDEAPVIHTPTADSVKDISEIDTRVPPDDMHKVDFADVVGKQPVVLMFATPALCQSRVCGPVVDIAQQVERDHADGAAFIHMEIYANNKPPALRPQVKAYGLQTEPWTFVIGADGKIDSRFEGAISISELEAALDAASGKGST